MARKAADEITLSRLDVMRALNTVKPALASRSAKLPDEIMADFCLTGDAVFAYDGVIALRAPLDSGVIGAVNGEVLLGMLANAAAKDVVIAVANDILNIRIVKTRIKLPLRPKVLVDERFRWPDLSKLTKFIIPDRAKLARALTLLLETAIFETGKGADLANVMLAPDGEVTWLYSTDKKSFSQWEWPMQITRWPKVEQTAGGVILPVPFCQEAISLLKSKDYAKDEITLSFTEKWVVLQAGGTTLLGRAIYPADPFDFATRIVQASYRNVVSQPWEITPAFRHAISRAVILLKGMKLKTVGTMIVGKGTNLLLTTVGDAGRIEDAVSTGEATQEGSVHVEPGLIERAFDAGEKLEMTLLGDNIGIKDEHGYLYIAAGIQGGAQPQAEGEEEPETAGDPVTDEAPRRRRAAAE